ncbi:MAG: NAD(P)H-hydrate epimerase, partial [Spirochaetia bacterium]|nr:NAD(P)H-hydrate epimerase [Spirochaetia bacterium]
MNTASPSRRLGFLNPEAAQKLDAEAIRSGIPSSLLMENAGNAMGEIILRKCREANLRKILILAGTGNNGGDGLVIARFLTKNGLAPEVFLVNALRRKHKGLFLEKLGLLKKILEKDFFSKVREARKLTPPLKKKILETEVLVDALFGTGLSRPLGEPFKKIISAANESKAFRFSVDTPSGLDFLLRGGAVFRADETLSVQTSKETFLAPWFAEYTGRVWLVPIDYPASLVRKHIAEVNEIVSPFPEKSGDFGNKFSGGRQILCAGSARYPGAALLAARSALAHGASYLYLVSPSKPDIAKVPQLIPISGRRSQVLAPEDLEAHRSVFEKSQHILFGPGVDRLPETQKFLENLLSLRGKNILIDADGLFHLGNLIRQKHPNLRLLKQNHVILTPHLGEFAELLSASGICQDPVELRENLFSCLRLFCSKYVLHVFLKDAFSYY